MGILVILIVLLLPFVLISFSRHRAGQAALALFWMACGAGAVYFRSQAQVLGKDLAAVHTYALPESPGLHQIPIRPLSQGSMKAVLTGGAGPLSRKELESLHWIFNERFLRVTWFNPREHDGPEPGDILLFYLEGSAGDAPLQLEYRVGEGQGTLLQGRRLAVGHDAGARHLLRDHAKVSLDVLTWILAFWGGLWMTVQGIRQFLRRRAAAPSPT